MFLKKSVSAEQQQLNISILDSILPQLRAYCVWHARKSKGCFDADDIVQTACLEFIEKNELPYHETKSYNYAAILAKQAMHDVIRDNWHFDRNVEASDIVEMQSVDCWRDTPVDKLIEGLFEVADKKARPIVERMMRGERIGEIAQSTGLTRHTVRHILQRLGTAYRQTA